MKLSLEAIAHQTKWRGKAYMDELVASGSVSGQTVDISSLDFARIVAKHPPRLGDIVEIVAKPIAKALHLDCLDANGQLKDGSPCAKRRDALNKLL